MFLCLSSLNYQSSSNITGPFTPTQPFFWIKGVTLISVLGIFTLVIMAIVSVFIIREFWKRYKEPPPEVKDFQLREDIWSDLSNRDANVQDITNESEEDSEDFSEGGI